MTTFTALSDTSLSQDKPFTQSIARAMRDNPVALAEGDMTAPEVTGVSPMMVATASSSTALVFNNLPDGYDNLEFDVVKLIPSAASPNLLMDVSYDNGATWIGTSSYLTNIQFQEGAITGAASAYYATGWHLTSGDTYIVSPYRSGINGRVLANNFSTSGFIKTILSNMLYVKSNLELMTFRVSGYISVAPASKVTAVRFRFSTGVITSGYVAMRRVRPS